jgi:hypothetical protein
LNPTVLQKVNACTGKNEPIWSYQYVNMQMARAYFPVIEIYHEQNSQCKFQMIENDITNPETYGNCVINYDVDILWYMADGGMKYFSYVDEFDSARIEANTDGNVMGRYYGVEPDGGENHLWISCFEK